MSIVITEEFAAALARLNARKSVLITGKAGTGKSTLLREWINSAHNRNILVTAPTGVAALNIDGFTIHRSFGFRPGMYPDDLAAGGAWKPTSRIRKLLKTIDALVVDEISMVRADLFDMMDLALRDIRDSQVPFGGVQLVLVGDLLQLPPIVDYKEARVFESRWETPFFFSSHVFRELHVQNIHLTTVWRQVDSQFLEILNQVREGNVGESALEVLNQRVDPNFQAPDGWVTLASRRNRVALINESRLDELDTRQFTSQARYTGKFDSDSFRSGKFGSNSFPGSEELTYAVGARVMTIRNDEDGRFVNGSFGTITRATMHRITVRLDHSGEEVELGKHTWEIKEPTVTGGMLSSEIIGTVTQFPVILAWAITIHKAQGKTIPKLFIDLSGGTRTEGQFYVALSRAVDLENVRFSAPVKTAHIRANNSLVRQIRREVETGESTDRLVLMSFDGVDFGISNHLARVHVIVLERGETVAEFGSWINPMADLGDFGERNNIPVGGLALAPALGDFWPLLLRQSAGALVIADGLPMVERAVRHQEKGMDLALGHGYDASELDIDVSGEDVMQRCRSIRDALIRKQQFSAYGHLVPPAAQDTEGAVFIPSWAPPSPMVLDPQRATASDRAWAAYSGGETENQDRDELVETAELLSAWALSRGSWTAEELADVRQRAVRAGVTHLDLPNVEEPDGKVGELLAPGTRVAFTGVRDLIGGFDDDRLKQICSERGLTYAAGVSRTRCDVLVACDRASMSRKAQNAREYGKPIVTWEAFEEWCASAGSVPSEPMTVLPQEQIEEAEVVRELPVCDDLRNSTVEVKAKAEVVEKAEEPKMTEPVRWETPEEFLKEGIRVAFRGSTIIGNKLYPHGEALQNVCVSLGIEYKQAVTKTRCDLLVTDSAEGSDGKMKLARRYGTPLMRQADFSRWATKQLDDETNVDNAFDNAGGVSPARLDEEIVDDVDRGDVREVSCDGVHGSELNSASFSPSRRGAPPAYMPPISPVSSPSYDEKVNSFRDPAISGLSNAAWLNCGGVSVPSLEASGREELETGVPGNLKTGKSGDEAVRKCKKYAKYALIVFLLILPVAGLAPKLPVLNNVGAVMVLVWFIFLGFMTYFGIIALIARRKEKRLQR
ncbi:AAA family ATPase [Trueperella sp. LYQ141]|uniref:AAA family ATPase n=1 Tax=Trueperella sp. LYQ141 TaxID=3391058 RepID=UPI0039830E2A